MSDQPEMWAFADHPDAERWTGPFSTKHEAISNALSHYGDPEDGYHPCVSRCRPITESDQDLEDDWTFLVVGEVEEIEIPADSLLTPHDSSVTST